MAIITINSVNYSVRDLLITEELSGFDQFSCVLPNPTSAQRTALGSGGHLYPGHHVTIQDKYGQVFAGFVENVEDEENTTSLVLEGRDYRCLLIDERNGLDEEWINQTGATIINALLAKSTKVVAGTIDFSETVSGTVHLSNESLLNAIASVCNNAGKNFWVTLESGVFKLYVGARGTGSSSSPSHTWTVGNELVTATEKKLARDIINRQKVFGAGDGINQIGVCVPYIDIGVPDDARHAGMGGVNASCTHSAATTSQGEVGIMEGEPYYDASIVDINVAISTAKAILDSSVGGNSKKLSAVPKAYLSGVSLGTWVRVIDPYKSIDTTARIKAVKRKLDTGEMNLDFLSGNEGIEDILAAVKRKANLNNLSGIGATNLIALNYPDICDATHPYEFMFQLPPEVKFINRVKLTYIVGAYRGYSGTAAAGGQHSHGIQVHAPFDNSQIGVVGVQTYNLTNYLVSNVTVSAIDTVEASDTHTHSVSFGISEQAASLTDVALWIDDGSGYVDRTGALESELGRSLSTTQEVDIPITGYFTANGGIKKIKIIPTGSNDGECRITGLLTVQFYMESK